jgi:hypothetical protein
VCIKYGAEKVYVCNSGSPNGSNNYAVGTSSTSSTNSSSDPWSERALNRRAQKQGNSKYQSAVTPGVEQQTQLVRSLQSNKNSSYASGGNANQPGSPSNALIQPQQPQEGQAPSGCGCKNPRLDRGAQAWNNSGTGGGGNGNGGAATTGNGDRTAILAQRWRDSNRFGPTAFPPGKVARLCAPQTNASNSNYVQPAAPRRDFQSSWPTSRPVLAQ